MQDDIGISSYNKICLHVPSFMYVFLTIFGMYGICMWFVGCDLSLAWRMVGFDSGFPSLSISWIDVEIVGLFSCLFCLVLIFP